MNLIEAFDIRNDEVISLVGGGGKTTLMFALARELVASNHKVITTTTTHIGADEPTKFKASLLQEENEKILLSILPENLLNYAHLTVVKQFSPEKERFAGYLPEVIDRLAALGMADVIIEADGARRKPIKAPNATEPVIPASTTLVIPVVGMDALGTALNEDNAFRPEIISRLTGLKLGESITEDTVATLMIHPEGITKGTPASARIIPLLNKADKGNSAAAESIARKILAESESIKRVVVGQVLINELLVIARP